jgi:Uma2 family endonuclease
MAATTPTHLTLEEFEARYGSEPGWEYWFGKAVRKPVPDWFHAVLQILLGELLYRAGYLSGAELDLRAMPDWRPRPDISGALKFEGRYPTRLDIAIEILSENQEAYIREKCEGYGCIGIPQIFVFDPDKRTIVTWDHTAHRYQPVRDLHLINGSEISGESIWREFDKRIREHL